jgi:acyl-CoA thioesterase FadM
MGAFRIVEDMVTELMGDLRIDGVTCMKEYGAMWVFVRNRIEIPHQIEWMEEYTVTSYISSFSRVRLYIDTVMTGKDGSVALASRLELCAVDLETGKIRKAETGAEDGFSRIRSARETSLLSCTQFREGGSRYVRTG